MSRRSFLVGAVAMATAGMLEANPRVDGTGQGARCPTAGSTVQGLKSLTEAAQPISAGEHAARLAKLQGLMQQRGIAAFLVEPGATLEYFTGIQWWRSERTTAAVLPASGEALIVTPFFEEPSVRETLKIPAEIRPWKEDQSPFDLLAEALRGRIRTPGALAVEPTTRFFILDRVNKASSNARQMVSGEELVRACRMFKSPAELALLEVANQVTLAALHHVHAHVEADMTSAEIFDLLEKATEALGGKHEFSLVLLNEASAYPHGSVKPQRVRAGSVILIDSGCTVHGYQSDISRSWVFGSASQRQREVWDTVKRGQEIALEAAQPGVPVGAIDQKVRAFYERSGWRPDYGLPGLSHRTGHGIGLDGHEAPYLVRNDTTPLAPGMCFSDEPGLYIPGEFGIRLEDCWYMTEKGPKLFTPLARSITQPI